MQISSSFVTERKVAMHLRPTLFFVCWPQHPSFTISPLTTYDADCPPLCDNWTILVGFGLDGVLAQETKL